MLSASKLGRTQAVVRYKREGDRKVWRGVKSFDNNTTQAVVRYKREGDRRGVKSFDNNNLQQFKFIFPTNTSPDIVSRFGNTRVTYSPTPNRHMAGGVGMDGWAGGQAAWHGLLCFALLTFLSILMRFNSVRTSVESVIFGIGGRSSRYDATVTPSLRIAFFSSSSSSQI